MNPSRSPSPSEYSRTPSPLENLYDYMHLPYTLGNPQISFPNPTGILSPTPLAANRFTPNIIFNPQVPINDLIKNGQFSTALDFLNLRSEGIGKIDRLFLRYILNTLLKKEVDLQSLIEFTEDDEVDVKELKNLIFCINRYYFGANRDTQPLEDWIAFALKLSQQEGTLTCPLLFEYFLFITIIQEVHNPENNKIFYEICKNLKQKNPQNPLFIIFYLYFKLINEGSEFVLGSEINDLSPFYKEPVYHLLNLWKQDLGIANTDMNEISTDPIRQKMIIITLGIRALMMSSLKVILAKDLELTVNRLIRVGDRHVVGLYKYFVNYLDAGCKQYPNCPDLSFVRLGLKDHLDRNSTTIKDFLPCLEKAEKDTVYCLRLAMLYNQEQNDEELKRYLNLVDVRTKEGQPLKTPHQMTLLGGLYKTAEMYVEAIATLKLGILEYEKSSVVVNAIRSRNRNKDVNTNLYSHFEDPNLIIQNLPEAYLELALAQLITVRSNTILDNCEILLAKAVIFLPFVSQGLKIKFKDLYHFSKALILLKRNELHFDQINCQKAQEEIKLILLQNHKTYCQTIFDYQQKNILGLYKEASCSGNLIPWVAAKYLSEEYEDCLINVEQACQTPIKDIPHFFMSIVCFLAARNYDGRLNAIIKTFPANLVSEDPFYKLFNLVVLYVKKPQLALKRLEELVSDDSPALLKTTLQNWKDKLIKPREAQILPKKPLESLIAAIPKKAAAASLTAEQVEAEKKDRQKAIDAERALQKKVSEAKAEDTLRKKLAREQAILEARSHSKKTAIVDNKPQVNAIIKTKNAAATSLPQPAPLRAAGPVSMTAAAAERKVECVARNLNFPIKPKTIDLSLSDNDLALLNYAASSYKEFKDSATAKLSDAQKANKMFYLAFKLTKQLYDIDATKSIFEEWRHHFRHNFHLNTVELINQYLLMLEKVNLDKVLASLAKSKLVMFKLDSPPVLPIISTRASRQEIIDNILQKITLLDEWDTKRGGIISYDLFYGNEDCQDTILGLYLSVGSLISALGKEYKVIWDKSDLAFVKNIIEDTNVIAHESLENPDLARAERNAHTFYVNRQLLRHVLTRSKVAAQLPAASAAVPKSKPKRK